MAIGDRVNPAITCPECGPATPLIERTNSVNGSTFLGCSRYPECTYTRSIPESWRMRRAGEATLPGFE